MKHLLSPQNSSNSTFAALQPSNTTLHTNIKHGRRSKGTGGDKSPSPEFGVGDANANCPLRFSHMYKKEKYTKSVFRWGSASDPAGGAHDTPPHPLVGWGGDTPPHTSPHLTPTQLRRSPSVPRNSSQIYAYGNKWQENNTNGYWRRRQPSKINSGIHQYSLTNVTLLTSA